MKNSYLVTLLCKSGNPVCLDKFKNASIRPAIIENVAIAEEFMLLSRLEPKLYWYIVYNAINCVTNTRHVLRTK